LFVLVLVVGACARTSVGAGESALGEPTPPAGEEPSARPATTDPAEFARLLRSTVEWDYGMVASPEELRDESDLVVVGRLVEALDGRSLNAMTHNVTLVLDVEQVLAGEAALVKDGRVYLEWRTSAGGGVADFAAALPSSRVLVFLADRSQVDTTGASNAPEGALVFGLQSPMGFILDSDGEVLGGYDDLTDAPAAWRGFTFDEFIEAVRR